MYSPQELSWIRQWESENPNYSISAKKDSDDFIHIAGYQAIIDSENQIFLKEFDKKGTTIWTKNIKTETNIQKVKGESLTVTVDSAKNVYIAGLINSNPAASSSFSCLLALFDFNGNQIWLKS